MHQTITAIGRFCLVGCRFVIPCRFSDRLLLLLQRVADTELSAVSEQMHCSRFRRVVMQLFVVESSFSRAGYLIRFLLPVLFVLAGGKCRADLLFGATSGSTTAPLTFVKNVAPDPQETGYRLDTEVYKEFCDYPFAPVFLDPLYLEVPNSSLPDATTLGLPADAILFLSARANMDGDRLWQVSGFVPDPSTPYSQTASMMEFATTGSSLSASANVSGFDLDPILEAGTAGGGRYLATRFSAGDVISDSSFTSATTQAVMLYYETPGSVVSNVEGEFSQDGYLGFRVAKTDVVGGYYYGWLNITNVVTSLAQSAGGSGFTLYQIAARFAATGEQPGIVVGQTGGPGQFSAVPEPGSFAILGLLAATFGVRAYRRRERVA